MYKMVRRIKVQGKSKSFKDAKKSDSVQKD